MQEKTKFTLIAAAVAIVFVLFNSLYILPQTEQAIVLQFGEPVRLVKEPGLKFKVPFIQNVVFYDNRLLNLDPPAQEIVLNDKKRLDVDSFTRFRIIDPLKFYQTVRTEEQARSKLKEIVNSSVRKILGRTTLQELLSQKRTQIMSDISAAVKTDAQQIGVSVADVRIRRADNKRPYENRTRTRCQRIPCPRPAKCPADSCQSRKRTHDYHRRSGQTGRNSAR